MSNDKTRKLKVVCQNPRCRKEFMVSARDFCRKFCSKKCYRVQYQSNGYKYGVREVPHNNSVVPSE